MVVSYDKLELDDLRDDTLRVMALNFPNSKYPERRQSQRDRPWYSLW